MSDNFNADKFLCGQNDFRHSLEKESDDRDYLLGYVLQLELQDELWLQESEAISMEINHTLVKALSNIQDRLSEFKFEVPKREGPLWEFEEEETE